MPIRDKRSTVRLTDGRKVEVIDVYFRVGGHARVGEKDEREAAGVEFTARNLPRSAAPDQQGITRPWNLRHEWPQVDNEIRFRPAQGASAPPPKPRLPGMVVVSSQPSAGRNDEAASAPPPRQPDKTFRIEWRDLESASAQAATRPRPQPALWLHDALSDEREEEDLSELTGLRIFLSGKRH